MEGKEVEGKIQKKRRAERTEKKSHDGSWRKLRRISEGCPPRRSSQATERVGTAAVGIGNEKFGVSER